MEVLAAVRAGHDRELCRLQVERLDPARLDEGHDPERLDGRAEGHEPVGIAELPDEPAVDVRFDDVAAVDALLDAVAQLADEHRGLGTGATLRARPAGAGRRALGGGGHSREDTAQGSRGRVRVVPGDDGPSGPARCETEACYPASAGGVLPTMSLETGPLRRPIRPIAAVRPDAWADRRPRAWQIAVATLAAAMILASCTRDLSGLTGSPNPTPLPAGPGATASPAAAPATAQPSRAPKPYELAIAAFVKSVTSKKLSYRVAYDGETALSADTLPIAGRMDVSGADFAASWTYDFTKDYGIGKIRVEVRGVKGKGYIRTSGGAWKTIKNFDASDSYVPFKAVAKVDQVKYLGPATIDGTEYHKVSIPGAVLIHPTTLPGLVKQEKIDASKLELVIDDKGQPRRGSWELKARARVGESGQLQRVEYELDLQFSKVGAKLTIKRP